MPVAIFIDSKRDGNRAVPWQEGKTMSTPSVTILKNLVLNWESNQMEEETIATFYRHYDGYPSCHAVDIASSLIVASRTNYVVTGAYDNFGGKVSIGAEEYLSRINIKVYEGDENGNLVFEGGAAECLAWADGYCGHC